MCGFGVFSLTTIALLGLYGYVVFAQLYAEFKATGGLSLTGIVKAVGWPLTIWSTINKLYLTKVRG